MDLSNLTEKIDVRTEQYNSVCQGYDAAEAAIREKLEQDRQIWFDLHCKEQEEELQAVAVEFARQFKSEASLKLAAAEELTAKIAQLRSTVDAATEIARHKEEEKNKQRFYQLQLDQPALDDIEELKEIIPRLNQPEVLGKMIWKIYYEKPYTDLIGRVFFGSRQVCGIYKITNVENEMCYVGQAVNIPERWKQHIKRAIGAETPTQNKLYPAMAQVGVHNFTFEIIEEVPKAKLNAREDYWQEFYKAKEFGYSIK